MGNLPGILLECILTTVSWMRSDLIEWSMRSFIITLWWGQKALCLVPNSPQRNIPVQATGSLVCVTMSQSVPISLSIPRCQNRQENITHFNTWNKTKSVKFFKATEKCLGNMRLLLKVRWKKLGKKSLSFGIPIPWLVVTEGVDSKPGPPHKSDSI